MPSETPQSPLQLQCVSPTKAEDTPSKPMMDSKILVDATGRTFSFDMGHGEADNDKTGVDPFLLITGISQIACLILFGLFVEYEHAPEDPSAAASEFTYYNNVAFMMLIGFGFLMTFLRNYGMSSIGMTFLLTTVILQWTVLFEGFWEGIYNNKFHYIKLGMFDLISGNFAAATILISFGCLIGKISPSQMLLLGLLELPFYSFNYGIIIKWLGVVDIGGSIAIHMFGAFFGLAAAYVWGHQPTPREEQNEAASRSSDIFSMIGTIFLWIYWPSFNGAPAAHSTDQQLRVTVNTVLSLSSCCIGSFFFSRLLDPKSKFSPADIQNATLAGGVAIGSSANMIVTPAGAMAIGLFGGVLSVWGFRWLQPFIQEKLGLHDTCGVQNLHGWPSVAAAIISAIVAAVAKESDGYTEFDSVFPEGKSQGGAQIAGMLFTLIIASLSGALMAYLVKIILPKQKGGGFRDVRYWEVEKEV